MDGAAMHNIQVRALVLMAMIPRTITIPPDRISARHFNIIFLDSSVKTLLVLF